MMKEILEPLTGSGLLFRRLEPFDLKTVGSRKRIGLYFGVDEEGRYTLLFHVRRKSRVLRKDVREWMELREKIEAHFGHPILRNVALIEAPLCSKAKALLESEGWLVIVP